MFPSRFGSRSLGLSLLTLLPFVSPLRGQGIDVRVESVRLLERANVISSIQQIGVNYQHDVTFHSFGVDGVAKDGRFTAIFSGRISRFEWSFGDFHAVVLHYPEKKVQDPDYQPEPVEALEMDRLTPVLIGQFDQSDTIESIRDASLSGRPAKCIEFETVNGRSSESNEVCIDAERGTLLRWQVGNERTEDSDYLQFQGVWLPAHIEHYINGQLRMVIDQTFQVIPGPIDWESLTPAHALTFRPCDEFKRAVVQSAPQPASAGAGPWYDVAVNAVVGVDGRVHDPSVLPEGKPELEAEALKLVSGWSFSPAVCNGKTIPVNARLVVHFPPQ